MSRVSWLTFTLAAATSEPLLAGAVDAQTSLRAVQSANVNPKNPSLFGYDSETRNKFLLREVVHYQISKSWRLEFNVYNLIQGSTDKSSLAAALQSGTDENNRSPKLERHWHDSHKLDGYLTVDRLNVRGRLGGLEVAAGRLPVHFGATMLFTPNDLFAPFHPTQSYREHKPGVDALRFDYGVGKSWQVSLLGVAGFESSAYFGRVGAPKERRFSPGESSVITRLATTLGGFETALLGGKYGGFDLAGFSLQGEIKDFGIRAEGHQKKHRRKNLSSAEVAAGIDYRLTKDLVLQVEQFFHGSGYGNIDEYKKLKDDPYPPVYFIGRNYTGALASYELTPLVQLRTMALVNLTDISALWSFNVAYAVAENAEVTASYSEPRGKGAKGEVLRSEYGTYPRILNLETGIYF